MAPESWRFERALSHKPQGHVWIVSDAAGRSGYFKFASPDQWRYAGPAAANEWIAARLARELGFPVADLAMAEVAGPDGQVQRGVVSIAVRASEVTTWADVAACVRAEPEARVADVKRLRGLVAFDAWIVNVDRGTGRNLVLHRDGRQVRYRWYLIDHGLALLGAPSKWERHAWHDGYWDDLWCYHHVPQGLLRLQSSWSALAPVVDRIEGLAAGALEAMVACAPEGTMTGAEREQTLALLVRRQARLRAILERWLAFEGEKEFDPDDAEGSTASSSLEPG